MPLSTSAKRDESIRWTLRDLGRVPTLAGCGKMVRKLAFGGSLGAIVTLTLVKVAESGPWLS
jgi:hypothetical protein